MSCKRDIISTYEPIMLFFLHMPHFSDQIYFENLYCVGQEEIGQAGYLLEDPRSFVVVGMCFFFLFFILYRERMESPMV